MVRLTKTIFLGFIVLQLPGCALFDSGSDIVVGDYEVTWIDLHESRSLNKGEELVPAYVFAVGHNSKYIYAKQHPLLVNSPEKIDKSITNYFIIEQTTTELQDKPKYGPLTKQSFDSLCIQLQIDKPKFDMTYPTNLY
ncbi:MAG TPA: hypothetical protein VLC98_04040 [Phnomibacter sp.]|nr:hypothetical protein [Phnomibacter sp.]